MSVYEKLFDYQKNIVDFIKCKKSFGLFLDMGLGKTPIATSLAEINTCNKVIVITINSKAEEKIEDKGSWQYWFSQSSLSYCISDKKTLRFNQNEPTVLIINYESLFNRKQRKTGGFQLNNLIIDFINSCKNQKVCMIVDESHKLKNLNSQQTKAVFKIQSLLRISASDLYTYILTGTPFTLGYIDLYSQLKLLGYSENKTTFVDRFCIKGNIPGLLGWQQPIVGYKNVEMLYTLIHRYAITIKSSEVINLPETIFVNHELIKSKEFDLFVNEKYPGNSIKKELINRGVLINDNYNTASKINNPFYRNINYPDEKWLCDTIGTFYLRCKQLSIGFQGNNEDSKWFNRDRLMELKRLLENEKDNYIIFYNYTPELFEIFDICDKLNYNIDVYCGEIKNLYNYNTYSNMTEDERINNKNNVIIANYASGSTGMNWQEYNKCILFSIPLYKDYEQCLKRIHRVGQKKTVIYHVFYQNNWLDKRLLKSLSEKKEYDINMFKKDLNMYEI